MSNPSNDKWAEDREQWLTQMGCSETDVMEDGKGEFIMEEIENGTPGEDGFDVKRHKVYLPDLIQSSYESENDE